MYSGISPYTRPGCFLFFAHTSLHFSRIPTLQTQILTPVQDPNTSHAKPCTVNPYAREAFKKFQKLLRLAQAPNSSHANTYAGEGSQNLQCFLMLGQAPNDSNDSLCRGSVPTIPRLPYAGAGFWHFKCR
ncbi:hypothetical protein O181_128846 [Austropuccinia psidii MF-1]|uniref:Uncharacterized protein n=1 Tax=Austropuccinia psidii MF-1 TaxID=1389203 RepID=A0A9Q3Q828_9BASI|nr:hypothetical protein [Austropuccinia psidii MF-1]